MKYIQCKRCLMDTTAEDIFFDQNGICNYCKDFEKKLKNNQKRINISLEKLVDKIKQDGKNKPYNCIVGISGGVDSSYTLVKVKELGLTPLAVHMDNGWDSELASHNIKNLVEILGVDLYTHVIDWDEYRKLMQAFFDADVIDIELLYDNAMLAVNYIQANKYGIKYILSGTNTSTEGMRMPPNWNWFKFDKKNILNIAKKNNVKIKTFPIIGTLDFYYYEYIKGIKWISFLDYLPEYNKSKAIDILKKNFQYKPYPYKHYESVFTRFYQGYILPKKFGIDKRKLHFSTLIMTNQMTRNEAKTELGKIAYPDINALNKDIEYFLKKMLWKKKELDIYLKRPAKSHSIYGTEKYLWDKLYRISTKYKKILKLIYYFIFKNR